MFANIILNLILIIPLAHAGLALATSLATFINAGLLYVFLRKKQVYQYSEGWRKFFAQIVSAALAMSLLLIFLVPEVKHWLTWDVYQRVYQLAIWIFLGAVTYISVLWLCGLRVRDMTLNTEQV